MTLAPLDIEANGLQFPSGDFRVVGYFDARAVRAKAFRFTGAGISEGVHTLLKQLGAVVQVDPDHMAAEYAWLMAHGWSPVAACDGCEFSGEEKDGALDLRL